MYKGEYSHTIDAKGRIIVPAKLREQLGDDFVVTKGLDGCLWIFDAAEWEKVESAIRELPLTVPAARVLSRFIFAGAIDGELDKQGRLLIPSNLRDYAGLSKDVIFSGVGSRVEIWDKDKYDSAADSFENMDTVTQQLIELGLKL